MHRSLAISLSLLVNFSLALLTTPAASRAEPRHADSRFVFGSDHRLPEAEFALRRGNHRRAEGHARDVLTASSVSRERMAAYAILCITHRKMGELDESLRACDEALRRTRGRDWQVLRNRAATLMRIGRVDESLQNIRSAAEILGEEIERSKWRPSAARRKSLNESLALLNGEIGRIQRIAQRSLPSVGEPTAEAIRDVAARAHGPASLTPTGGLSDLKDLKER